MLIQEAIDGKWVLEVSAVAVSEIFYALRSSYAVGRREAAATLSDVLNTPAFSLTEPGRILDALARVQSANIDFGDAYLAATAVETAAAVASFDRDFDRFADVKRHEP